ncbi:hypothetical protein TraAM80_06686 [Trypanosoma rangeli]|uniref:Uncharacterized protein n=1 Tax=Trypanosoma rangeli TaxID=5698 RepID=A0A3R7MG81_TRYRA|nr:uncharacterized protein TraAM80_06686 [Trypanosoma rangeli]RNF01966.1 hypothetical protein TraAM80_06686 [Trypanosoma rangeli]|eukprot:RNF01966.1 hypothetical protein TraAM80_06686 [Trypanosoma rangeli]
MHSGSSQGSLVGGGREAASGRSRKASGEGLCSLGSGNGSGGRAKPEKLSASSVPSGSRQSEGTPRVRRPGSNASNGAAKNFSRGSPSGDLHQNQNRELQRQGGGGVRHSRGGLKQISKEEMDSLLFRKPRLEDVRPDMYRLDLSQKKDLQFLYEAQHRVDPELFPFKKNLSRARWKHMHQSHIFDTDPPPTQRASVAPAKKNDDGLGTLARFILNSEAREPSPVRGRRHRSDSAGKTKLRLFDNNSNEGNSRSASPALRTCVRQVRSRPADKLGGDLRVRNSLDEAGLTPRGIRSKEAVQKFESTQPQLTLPPRKPRQLRARATRSFSASDNDIFGVRKRREHMMGKTRSFSSARSSEPYGSESPEGTASRRALSLRSASLRGEKRSNSSKDRRTTSPFGEEKPRNGGTPTRRHERHRGGSFSTRPESVASSSTLLTSSYVPSSRGTNSERHHHKKDASRRRRAATSASQVSSAASVFTENEENLSSPRLLPAARTGRARVPGRSITKSNVVFGGGQVPDTARSTHRRLQHESPQMHGILSWN